MIIIQIAVSCNKEIVAWRKYSENNHKNVRNVLVSKPAMHKVTNLSISFISLNSP